MLANLSQISRELIADLRVESSITSTNDILLSEKPIQNTALFTEEQTKGRGRLDRTWVSPPNKNIYFSLAWHFKKNISELSGLSLIIAIAIVRALKSFNITENIQIKWPNDIVFNNKKLGGILIETANIKPDACLAIIGIGLNINLDNTDLINQPWISLKQITHANHDRNILAALLLNHLCEVIIEFEKNNLTHFISEWKSHDALFEKDISLKINSDIKLGIAQGINSQGALCIKTAENTVEKYQIGEVSINYC